MPLVTLMVEDGFGSGIHVDHFCVARECAETLDSGFFALKKSVGQTLLSKNQVL